MPLFTKKTGAKEILLQAQLSNLESGLASLRKAEQKLKQVDTGPVQKEGNNIIALAQEIFTKGKKPGLTTKVIPNLTYLIESIKGRGDKDKSAVCKELMQLKSLLTRIQGILGVEDVQKENWAKHLIFGLNEQKGLLQAISDWIETDSGANPDSLLPRLFHCFDKIIKNAPIDVFIEQPEPGRWDDTLSQKFISEIKQIKFDDTCGKEFEQDFNDWSSRKNAAQEDLQATKAKYSTALNDAENTFDSCPEKIQKKYEKKLDAFTAASDSSPGNVATPP